MRQACDTAVREARRRQEGHIADDTQELLTLILPTLLLPAPNTKNACQTAPERMLKFQRKAHTCTKMHISWWEKELPQRSKAALGRQQQYRDSRRNRRRGASSWAMKSQGIAVLGHWDLRKIGKLLAQDNPPPLPAPQWKQQGSMEASDLDYPTLCDTVRTAAREGGADACGTVHKHNKPLLVDHNAMGGLRVCCEGNNLRWTAEGTGMHWLGGCKVSDSKGKLRPLHN